MGKSPLFYLDERILMILIKNEAGTRAKCKVVSACCYPDSHNGTFEEV